MKKKELKELQEFANALAKRLNGLSDEVAEGNVYANVAFNEETQEWEIKIGGHICIGNDHSSDNTDPIWRSVEDDLVGVYRNEDPGVCANEAQSDVDAFISKVQGQAS